MSETLKIVTFGGLSIHKGSTPVTGFVSRKVDALVVYLACERREHPREILADLLWDDLPANRSMANLRMVLSSMQQQLAEYVTVTRQSVALNPDCEVWVDVAELESELDRAEALWIKQGRLPRLSGKSLEQALALYKGEFLAGFHVRDSRGFEGWQLLQQERLRGRVIEALRRLVSQALERREYAAGIEHATRLLQIDPIWEEAHRQLMMMLALDGQRSAALAQYETCVRLLQEELDVEPDDETTELYERLQAGEIEAEQPAEAATPSSIPIPATPFVGRAEELDQIMKLVSNTDCRLLTLVGIGGMGKTRLALQTATERAQDFLHGVHFISLASVTSADLFCITLAGALKVALDGSGDPVTQIASFLRDKEMLLVLDNFEDVLDQADLLSRLLAKSPALKLIVTSRERLNLQEEWVVQVEGMDYPADAGHVENGQSYGALQLFMQSATRLKPDFYLNGNSPHVARICRLVDGMPLGIELAASWVRLMPCDEIAAQIERDLGLLATTLRNVPQRHRSVKVLFEESWRTLPPAEQAVLMKLSIFRDAFDRDGAEKVAGATLPILLALVEKSLVRSDASGSYGMHSLLQRYASEKLNESGQQDVVAEAHCAYFMEKARATEKHGDKNPELYDRALAQYNDYRAAMEWAEAHRRNDLLIGIADALGYFWRDHGLLAEGRSWFERVLTRESDTLDADTRARALGGAGIIAWNQGDFADARRYLDEGLALWRTLDEKIKMQQLLNFLGYVDLNTGEIQLARGRFKEILELTKVTGDRFAAATATGNLGMIASEMGDFAEGQRYMEEALALAREIGLHEKEATILNNLGVIAFNANDYERARARYEESLKISTGLNSRPNMAIAQGNLAELAQKTGKFSEAETRYKEVIEYFHDAGDKLNLIRMLETYAVLAIDLEELEHAVVIFGTVEAQREALNAPRSPREVAELGGRLDWMREHLPKAEFDAAWEQGRELTLSELTKMVLKGLPVVH